MRLVINGDGTANVRPHVVDLGVEPCPTIMDGGIAGVSRRGWQYWLEGGGSGPSGRVPRESATPESDPEAFGRKESNFMECSTRLAVSLEDLDRVPLGVRSQLLGGRLDLENLIPDAEQRRQVMVPAVEFCCDLLVAASIVDIMRSWDRAVGVEPIRAYVSVGGSWWSRVPGNRILALTGEDGARLNPTIFAVRVIPSPIDASIEARPVR